MWVNDIFQSSAHTAIIGLLKKYLFFKRSLTFNAQNHYFCIHKPCTQKNTQKQGFF